MTPETLAAVRHVLPAWAIWLPVAAPFLAAPIAYGLAWLGAFVAAGSGLRTLDPEAHWTERARHVSVVRRTLVQIAALPVLATLPLAVGGPVSVGHGVVGPLVVVVALACLVAVAFQAENRWVRKLPTAVRARSLLSLLLAGYAGVLAPLVLLAFRPNLFAAVGLVPWLLTLVVVVAVFGFGGGLLLARALRLIGPPPERLRAALARALPPGVRAPRLFTVRALSANALALPWLGTILVTEGALEHLDDDGLAAVVAHELAHLREPAPVRALRALFGLATALVLPVAISVGTSHALAAFAFALAYLAAAVGYLRWSLKLEQRADAAGQQASPAYASALEAIHRANLLPVVTRRRTSHPDLVERAAAAGVSPSWPIPAAPPSPFAAVGAVAFVTFFLVAGLTLVRVLPRSAHDERGYVMAVALDGRADNLGWLGNERFKRGAFVEAIPLFRAAAELTPGNPLWPAWEATSLALSGRCQEASFAMTTAAAAAAGDRTFTAGAQAALSTCVPR